MTALALAAAAALLPLLIIASINVASAPRLHAESPRARGPAVSVLIPARDEAANLRRTLPAILATPYRPLEVLVLDDGSGDRTAEVVAGFAAADPRLRLVEGREPPSGWVGKNWACAQLADRASGEILLFCDADVTAGRDAVARTVAAMERRGADVLTAFPRHEPGGWAERAVVPLVALVPVAALLPLALVPAVPAPSLAVGNGQWMAWRRPAYDAVGGHARVRGDVLEDVALARAAKERGQVLLPVVASRDLDVRMYRGLREVWAGFGKNLYPLLGGSPAGVTLGLATLALTAVLPLLLPALPGAGAVAWFPLALLVGVRVLAATLFRTPLSSVALHPVGAPLVGVLAVWSALRHRRGTVAWKRRRVPTREGT